MKTPLFKHQENSLKPSILQTRNSIALLKGQAVLTEWMLVNSAIDTKDGLSENDSLSKEDSVKSNKVHLPRPQFWIIERELLLYRTINLSNIPAAHRDKVIEQRIRQLSPFSNPAYYLSIKGGRAMIWLWDRHRQEEAITQAQIKGGASKLKVIPETILHPSSQNGLVKQSCSNGFDLQYWSSGVLRASQWISSEITDSNSEKNLMAGFARGQAVKGVEETPWGNEALTWLAKPWTEQSKAGFAWLLREKVITLALLFVLGGYGALQLGWLVGGEQEVTQLAEQVAQKRDEMMPLLTIREQAIAQKHYNDVLSDWLEPYTQLEVLAEFDSLLPFKTLTVVDWRYQRGIVAITVRDSAADNRSYVEHLSKSSMFSNVRVGPALQKDALKITLNVVVNARDDTKVQDDI